MRNRDRLHGINVIALTGTAFFVVVHYLQTAVFYDGLGHDLPVITSQSSVIFLLVIVAGQEFWPMFAFGFLFLFIVTQMHRIGLPRAWKWVFGSAFIGAVLFIYADRGWGNLDEIFRIPIIDYAWVALIGGLILLGKKISAWRNA